jgi:hypothetical protein
MGRGILAGRKTQTRRVGKIQSPHHVELAVEYSNHATKGLEAVATYRAFPGRGTARWGICACPHGIPGDRLWVRETWRPQDGMTIECQHKDEIEYRADGDRPKEPTDCHWKPSIFMPRWASRITLELTDLRVERLQEISEDDAIAEGLYPNPEYTHAQLYTWDGVQGNSNNPRYAYQLLWESINGANSWAENRFNEKDEPRK